MAKVHVRERVLVMGDLPAPITQALAAAATCLNPAYVRRQQRGLSTRGVAPTITRARRTPEGLDLPRGLVSTLLELCRAAGVHVDVIDETIRPALTAPLTLWGTLRPYQETALNTLLARRNGVLVASTGAGKTAIVTAAVARLQTPALIIVGSLALLQQMADECRRWLGITPGVIGDGRFEVCDVMVATVHTLARRDLTDLVPHVGVVLVDECHHAPARTWADVLDQFPARYRYGFTATPFRRDGLDSLITATIGPVTARVSVAEVQATGATLAPTIEVVETAFDCDIDPTDDWAGAITALVNDPGRNALLASVVRARLTPATRALVLTERVDHAQLVAGLLADLDPVVLTGALGRVARAERMTLIRNGARLTVASTALLGEGVDVPGWDVLVLATPMAGGARTLQAVGRVTRAAPGKTAAVVVDLVDRRVPVLRAAYRKRQRMYAEVVAA